MNVWMNSFNSFCQPKCHAHKCTRRRRPPQFQLSPSASIRLPIDAIGGAAGAGVVWGRDALPDWIWFDVKLLRSPAMAGCARKLCLHSVPGHNWFRPNYRGTRLSYRGFGVCLWPMVGVIRDGIRFTFIILSTFLATTYLLHPHICSHNLIFEILQER